MNRNNSHNEFVGNFNSFFDNESSLTGALDFGVVAPIGSGAATNPVRPRNLTVVGVTGPKPNLSPAISFVNQNTPKYRCKITPPYYVRDDINGTILDYTKCPKTNVAGASVPTPSGSGSGSSSGGSGTDSGSTTTGGAGSTEMPEGVMPAETTETTSGGGDAKKTAITECKINYIPVIIGLIVLAIIGYAIAKQKKKDVKLFSIVGAILGAILGYVYSKHQCAPVEGESNYYGGR